MKLYNIITVLVLCLAICSCRSTRKLSESVTNQTLSENRIKNVIDDKTEKSNTSIEDSSESVSIIIITEYDTDRLDEKGQSTVRRTTTVMSGKKTKSKNNTESETRENLSATKEESAEQVKQENNQREDTKAETKQPLYYSYILFGVAFVILMAVLAYWVFTKYRAARPLE